MTTPKKKKLKEKIQTFSKSLTALTPEEIQSLLNETKNNPSFAALAAPLVRKVNYSMSAKVVETRELGRFRSDNYLWKSEQIDDGSPYCEEIIPIFDSERNR